MYFNKKQDIKIHIRGGWLTTINGGTMFTSDNGSYVFFQGIRFTTSFALHNSAYQIFGYIHISRRWLENGFSLNHFAHEYGHYLQQKDKGLLRYLFFIAIPSLFSALKEPSAHIYKPYEVDATVRGNDYVRNNMSYTSLPKMSLPTVSQTNV